MRQWFLRITVENPDRDHFRVGGTAANTAGLRGKDWRAYEASHNRATATRTEKNYLSGWSNIFKQLGSKDEHVPQGSSLKAVNVGRIQGFALYLSCFDILGESEKAYEKAYAAFDKTEEAEAFEDKTEERCTAAVEEFVDAYYRTFNEARESRTVGTASSIASKLHATADAWKGILATASGHITADNVALLSNSTALTAKLRKTAEDAAEKELNERSGGRIQAARDTKAFIRKIIDAKKAKDEAAAARARGDAKELTEEEKKIAKVNENLGIVKNVETGIELVYKFAPNSFTGSTLAKDLRQAAACSLGIATAAVTAFLPTNTAAALNTCISWVGTMVLRRLKRLDLAANNRLKRQRFAGAPQTKFLNALRFTRSYTKELMAIVRKADKAIAEAETEAPALQRSNTAFLDANSGFVKKAFASSAGNRHSRGHHRFSPVTRDVLQQVLCGVNAMNKYYSFVRAADSLSTGEDKDEERIEAEEFAMELAQGFQRDLSRSLQLEQLKLSFDIAGDMEEWESMLMEGAVDVDDDDDDVSLPEANTEALNAWQRVVREAEAEAENAL